MTAFHVRLRPAPAGESQDHYVKRARRRSKPLLPGVQAVPAAERAANNQIVDLAHSVAWGTSSIALLVGILGIANTMAMSVFERTREIGILRALGWKGRHVILLILTEATALGFAGGLLGIAVGWGGSAPALRPAADREHRFRFRLAIPSAGVAFHRRRFRAGRRGLPRVARRAAFAGGGAAL